MAKQDDTGARAPTQPNLAEKIDRHLKGERVTTEYLNLQTGETIEVPKGPGTPSWLHPAARGDQRRGGAVMKKSLEGTALSPTSNLTLEDWLALHKRSAVDLP